MFNQLLNRDIHGIGMIKTNGNTYFNDHGTERTAMEIFKANSCNLQQLQDGSTYFSTIVTFENEEGKTIALKLVFTESVSENKEFVCIATTDIDLSDQTIILLYRIRWNIETFYQVSKSEELDLPKNGQGLSLAGIYADMALNCIYYMILAYLNSLSSEKSSLYDCFYKVAKQCQAVKAVEEISIAVSTALSYLADRYNLNFSQICEEVSPILLEQENFKKIWRAASMSSFCSKLNPSHFGQNSILYIT